MITVEGMALPVAVGGIALGIVWFHISRLSVFYERRWFEDAKAILTDNSWSDVLRARIDPRISRPKPGGSATHCVYGVILTFILIWAAILIFPW